MKKIILSAITAILLLSCSRSGLAPIAKEYLPARLNEAMAEYMETVGEPRVDNMKVIYDCDSLCIIQGHASAKDAAGKDRDDTFRYIFVKDPFMTAMTGKPVYYDAVQGSKLLSGKELEEFRQKLRDGGSKTFNQYLAMGEPVSLFENN